MEIEGQGEATIFKTYCDRHTPKYHYEIHDVGFYLRKARRGFDQYPGKIKKPERSGIRLASSPNSREQFGVINEVGEVEIIQVPRVSTIAPIIPVAVLDLILEKSYEFDEHPGTGLISRTNNNHIADDDIDTGISVKRKNIKEVVISIARYWSLKREVRSGAALLKRLHLEPWTANLVSATDKDDEERKAKVYETLSVVRKDLEKVRILSDLIR